MHRNYIFYIVFFWIRICLCSESEILDLTQISNLDVTQQIEISTQKNEDFNYHNFNFSPHLNSDLQQTYSRDALWIKLNLSNPDSQSIEKQLSFTAPLMGKLTLLQETTLGDGNIEITQLISGSDIVFNTANRNNRLATFNLKFAPQSHTEIFIQRVSIHSLATKIVLQSPDTFKSESEADLFFLYFYLGGILCLIVYNFFIGLIVKDSNYFYYSVFALTTLCAALCIQGFLDIHFYNFLGASPSFRLMIFSSAAVVACLAFGYKFLSIDTYFPQLKLGYKIISLAGILTFIVGFFPNYNGSQIVFGHMVDLTIATAIIYNLCCGVLVYRRGNNLALFFLMSWLSIFVGLFTWFGLKYGVLAYSNITSNSVMFGNLGEMLILSFGLAYKFNIIDKEKNVALEKANQKEHYHRLVKVLSHDVASALSIFYGYINKLQNSSNHSESDLKTIGRLEKTANTLGEMLESVREEEVFNSFKLSAKLVPVDLFEIVQDTVFFYEDSFIDKNLKITIIGYEKTFVKADKTALANQIFANLLSNAIKFSLPDSEIRVKIEMLPNEVLLQVIDQGIGMTPEQINVIFHSEHTRSTMGTNKEPGSGLGSSLVKNYMKIFNGRIEVFSTTQTQGGKTGTSISLFFPKISN